MQNQTDTQAYKVVGVIADTHGALSQECFAALADCDVIIHAGDIGDLGIHRALKGLAPVIAVLGNNDFKEYGADVKRIAKTQIAGVRFLVAHYPHQVAVKAIRAELYEPGEPLPHVCIHGHTHVPSAVTGKDASPAQLILCPGSPTYPRKGSKPSIAKIVLNDGAVQEFWFEVV